jgi:drug/metabolite transporter (DMT)-like permease
MHAASMPELKTKSWIGAGFAIASAVLFGLSTPSAKALLGAVDPWLLAALLYLGSGLGLSACARLQHALSKTAQEAPLRRHDLPWLLGAVLSGGVAGPVLLMLGLATTPASSAALLLNLEALATMAIAWGVYKENADRRIVAGALCILAGALLLSWRGGAAGVGVGALAIAGACLAWGVDNNLTRRISHADPVQIAAIKGLVAGSINFCLALVVGAHLPTPPSALAAGVVGFFGYGVSLVLFVLALRHVGAARTGAYFSLAPFMGAVASLALFREPVTAQLIAAAVLMGIGLYLHLAERHEHTHAHEPMEHEHAHVHDEHHQHEHAEADPPGEPHSHRHKHRLLVHAHPHYPDLHHAHEH